MRTKRKVDAAWAALAILLVCLMMAFTSGCVEEQQEVWGNGDLPSEHIKFFGESNGSRLDFMQNQAIDRHTQIIIEIAKRILILEGADPNEVRLGRKDG